MGWHSEGRTTQFALRLGATDRPVKASQMTSRRMHACTAQQAKCVEHLFSRIAGGCSGKSEADNPSGATGLWIASWVM